MQLQKLSFAGFVLDVVRAETEIISLFPNRAGKSDHMWLPGYIGPV